MHARLTASQKKTAPAAGKATSSKAAAKDTPKETPKKEAAKKDAKDGSPIKAKKPATSYTAVTQPKGAAIPIDVTFEGDVAEAKVCVVSVPEEDMVH